MPHIIITGLPASGKTTLAKKISLETGYPVIHCDQFIYLENWIKKPYETYREDILKAISGDSTPKIIEGTYYDADDIENRRARLFHELLIQTKLVIILEIEQKTQVSRLINRCINRELGKEDQGICKETDDSRAELLIRAVKNYDSSKQGLYLLSEFAKSIGAQVKITNSCQNETD